MISMLSNSCNGRLRLYFFPFGMTDHGKPASVCEATPVPMKFGCKELVSLITENGGKCLLLVYLVFARLSQEILPFIAAIYTPWRNESQSYNITDPDKVAYGSCDDDEVPPYCEAVYFHRRSEIFRVVFRIPRKQILLILVLLVSLREEYLSQEFCRLF